MEPFALVEPALHHQRQFEAMMEEWKGVHGWMAPGALRRWSGAQSYSEWLAWIAEDKIHGEELYFLTDGERIYGAISIRFKGIGLDGHCGYGIRPSERRKGYAAKMLAMAIPIINARGINPIIIACDRENTGSAKTILKNGGTLLREVSGSLTGNIIQIYAISR